MFDYRRYNGFEGDLYPPPPPPPPPFPSPPSVLSPVVIRQALKSTYQALEQPTDEQMVVFREELTQFGELPQRNLTLNATTLLETPAATTDLLFHPYEPLLIVSDTKAVISAYDYKEAVR